MKSEPIIENVKGELAELKLNYSKMKLLVKDLATEISVAKLERERLLAENNFYKKKHNNLMIAVLNGKCNLFIASFIN